MLDIYLQSKIYFFAGHPLHLAKFVLLANFKFAKFDLLVNFKINFKSKVMFFRKKIKITKSIDDQIFFKLIRTFGNELHISSSANFENRKYF